MTEIRQLTVLGHNGFGTIPVITQFVADAAKAANLDEDAIFHCQMAVDEACTNVIEHAYGEENADSFEITCFVEAGRCTIQVVDHGKPFEPDKVPSPRVSEKLDEIKPGGIGLHLMKQLMDEVRFEFLAEGNKLVMVKTGHSVTQDAQDNELQVREDRHGIQVFLPSGQLDASVAPKLDETLLNTINAGHKWILVDLSEVTYISSRGLKALVSNWRMAHDVGGDVALCSVAPRVQSIIDTIGFNQIFNIYSSSADAIGALAERMK